MLALQSKTRSRRPRLSFIAALGALAFAPIAAAQVQQNTLAAALSIGGTGRVLAGGAIAVTTSSVTPTPAGSAPLYHHQAAARGGVRFEIQGSPGRPIILATGLISPFAAAVGTDFLHLQAAGAQVLVDGTNPSGIINFGAVIGASGSWSLDLPSGLPYPFPVTHFQGVVIDPTTPPFGIRLTAATSLEIHPEPETLFRNVLDAYTQAPVNPGYLGSLLSSTFKIGGADSTQFLLDALFTAAGLDGEVPTATRLAAIGPNTVNGSAVPTGAPTAGQSATLFIDIFDDYVGAFGAPARGERGRIYDLRVVEELGAWKLDGDQRDFEAQVSLVMQPGNTNPGGVDVSMNVWVESPPGSSRSLVSASIAGPQLLGLPQNQFPTATTAAFGVYTMNQGVHGGGDELFMSVALGVAGAGSSRLPLVETATAPRDYYDLTVTWSDGQTSGPYRYYLRSAVDVDLSPAAALAAIPAPTLPTGTVTASGLPGATLSLSFDPGALVGAAEYGASSVFVSQAGPPGFEFDALRLNVAPPATTLVLPIPGFASGVQSYLDFSARDVFDNEFRRSVTATY